MSFCKFCGKEAPLVKAHIIPESMYPFEEMRREPLVMIPSTPNIPRGKSRVGEYDPNLVCADCEAAFTPWDDYAIRIFRKDDYSVVVVRFTHHDDAHKAVMTPQRLRCGDDRVWFWHFYLAGYKCAIKVDRGPTPSTLSEIILRPNGPLRILVINFNETQEYRAMVSAVRNLDGFN